VRGLCWLWLALAASAARADEPLERLDHRGALGLTVSAGGEYAFSAATNVTDNGARAPIELGGTFSLTEHTELRAAARIAPPVKVAWSAYAGIRNSRGERWKTFFDLELAVHFTPLWAVGLRLGFGVQYELSPVVGIFAVAGVQGAGGQGLRLGFELLLGVQFRTYVLG
jgi:hypothetical protein